MLLGMSPESPFFQRSTLGEATSRTSGPQNKKDKLCKCSLPFDSLKANRERVTAKKDLCPSLPRGRVPARARGARPDFFSSADERGAPAAAEPGGDAPGFLKTRGSHKTWKSMAVRIRKDSNKSLCRYIQHPARQGLVRMAAVD